MSETKVAPGKWFSVNHVVLGDGLTICDCHVDDKIDYSKAIINAKLISAAPDMLEALIAISTNKHIDLGDKIYDVREAEGEGWEGTSVKQWSDAIDKIEKAIKKATA